MNRFERGIATPLSAGDFESLIYALINDEKGDFAARYVGERAAALFGGSTRSKTYTHDSPKGFGYRRSDINGGRRSFELKFRGDSVKSWGVEKDLWFRNRKARDCGPRVNLWYLFTDGPYGERPTAGDFERLGKTIPFLH